MEFLFLLVCIVCLYKVGKYVFSYYSKQKGKTNTDYDTIICGVVAEVYCNTISCIDALCEISIAIAKSAEKLISSVNKKAMDSLQSKALDNEINLREQEINTLAKSIPTFKFTDDTVVKNILAKHGLSAQELMYAETCVQQSIKSIRENLSNLKRSLIDVKHDMDGINFALARIKAFQFESKAIYYGILGGICSFPEESLRIFNEMSPRWDNMSKGLIIKSLDKKGFKMYQEMEFGKAVQCLNAAKSYTENYGSYSDKSSGDIKHRNINFFIAGSKALQQERDVFAGVINLLQSQWKPLEITVNSYSYQNFPKDVNIGGHQEQYDHFIQNHVNASVFILSGKAGAYTMEEFDAALDSLKKNGKPKIYVYSLDNGDNEADTVIHAKMKEEKQYWIEYKNIDELRLMLRLDLNNYLLDQYSKVYTLNNNNE